MGVRARNAVLFGLVVLAIWLAWGHRVELKAVARGCDYKVLPVHFRAQHYEWGSLGYRATKDDVERGKRWNERVTVGSHRYQFQMGAEAWIASGGWKLYMDFPGRNDGWGTVYRGQPRQGLTICGGRYVEWPNGKRIYPTVLHHFEPEYPPPATMTQPDTGLPT